MLSSEGKDMFGVRIYCESLEQGQEFFLPAFQKAFPKHQVTLVRVPSVAKVKKNRALKGVFDLANPDGLATIVDEAGREFPFATFEISDAVKTEDHELQRFPQVCSAMSYDLIFIKISPHHKETRAEFGGNINFNPLVIPTTLRDEYKFNGAFLLNWPNGANKFVCKRNPTAPSCPATGCIDMLDPVLASISATLQKGVRPEEGTYTFSNTVWANLDRKTKATYTSILDAAPSQADLFKEWAAMAIPPEKGYLRKRMVAKNELLVTIPRFDRDSPGPGEVMGYAMISKAKKVGIAYCGRDKGTRIDSEPDGRSLNHPCHSINEVMDRFFDIFSAGNDKMPVALLQLLRTAWRTQKSSQIDITKELAALARNNTKMKKWVLTFIFFADYLKIHDRPRINHPVTFKWDRKKIIGTSYDASNPMENLRRFNQVPATVNSAIALCDPPYQMVRRGGEDYITWGAVQILSQASFNWSFLALSYPGSQGDGAILPSGSHGLKRKRTYCDGLAVKKSRCKSKVGLILEAKHKETQIGEDIIKIKKLVQHEVAAMKTAFDRLGKRVVSSTTCVAFGVPDHGLSSSASRRNKLSGVDLAVTFSDTSGKYQVVDIKSGKILKEGKLPTHEMHSIA